jgi:hypothetical protein
MTTSRSGVVSIMCSSRRSDAIDARNGRGRLESVR